MASLLGHYFRTPTLTSAAAPTQRLRLRLRLGDARRLSSVPAPSNPAGILRPELRTPNLTAWLCSASLRESVACASEGSAVVEPSAGPRRSVQAPAANQGAAPTNTLAGVPQTSLSGRWAFGICPRPPFPTPGLLPRWLAAVQPADPASPLPHQR
ncbi:hypothetical protein VTN96DRAFT_7032 [Rasamsonia emersonii]